MPTPDRRLRPRKRPTQRRAQDTRDRILTAAARIFAARGYAGGTTNHIAAEAGVSVGSLYQYYPNKDALLAELMRAHVAEGTARLADHLATIPPAPAAAPYPDPGRQPAPPYPAPPAAPRGGSPPTGRPASGAAPAPGDPPSPGVAPAAGPPDVGLAARLRPFVDATIDNHRADPALHRVLFEEAPRPPDVVAELRALEAEAVAAAATLLRDDPQVTVPDPDLAAWFVVATIESLTHRYVGSHADGRLDLDAFGDELVRLLVAYLSSPSR